MRDWIRTEDLFCDEYRALILSDHSKELNLIKELIEITEKSAERKRCNDIFSFEGIIDSIQEMSLWLNDKLREAETQ